MYMSVRHIDSARLMPIALTLMRTSVGPGAGTSVSRNSRTSGPPAFANLIVRDILALRGLVRDRANVAFGAGIVHRDIETAKVCDGLVDQVADFIVVANVCLDEGGVGAQAAQLGFESLALRFPAAGNDEAGTVLGESQSGGAADAC